MPYKNKTKQKNAVKIATRKYRLKDKTIEEMFPGKKFVDTMGNQLKDIKFSDVRAFTLKENNTIEIIKKSDTEWQDYYDNIQ